MGRGFRESKANDQAILFGVVVTVLFLSIFLLYSLNRRWHWIRGKWVLIKRTLSGAAVSKPRIRKRYEVTIEQPYGPDRTRQCITEDLSPTGMFIRHNPPLKKGDKVRYSLGLDGDERIRGLAEVMWSQNRWTEHHPSGNGCRFIDISADDQKKIELSLKKK